MINRAFILGAAAAFFLCVPATAMDTAFSYQGRLSDAGSPADGDYDFQFVLYTAEIGGSQVGPILYGDDVQVIDGYFTIYLDFGAGVFDGSALWIEVQVKDGASTGSYTPLAPRQAVLPSPYALYSGAVEWGDIEGMPPGFADGTDDGSQYQAGNQLDLVGDTFDVVEGAGSGLDADTVDGQEAADFAASAHDHSGAEITSGVVAEPRIHADLARDSEIMPTVLANDGAGSGLNADKLDDQEAGDFAPATHNHSGAQITTGTVAEPRIASTIARDSEIMPTVLANDGSGSGLDADTIDGESASAFANSSHYHSGSQITTGTVADARITSTVARDTEVMPIVRASDGTGSGLDADMLDGHSTAYFEPSFTHGNGLDLIGGELLVDPTEFNGSSPIAASTGGGASNSTYDTWVLIDNLVMTAPSHGEVLIIGHGSIWCSSGCSASNPGYGGVGIGVNTVPAGVQQSDRFTTSYLFSEYDLFLTTTVLEGAEYQFRVYLKNQTSSSSPEISSAASLIYVFIPD